MKFRWYICEFSCVDRKSVSESVGHRRSYVRVSQIVFVFVMSLFFFPPLLRSPQMERSAASYLILQAE